MSTSPEISEICSALVLGITDYFKKNNFSKAVLGLSGGADSSVCAYLLVKALGKENVIGICLPQKNLTAQQNLDDAAGVAEILGIRKFIFEIDDGVVFFERIAQKIIGQKNSAATANAKARLRMAILYYIAQLHGALIVGTSNKSEIALGYTTKYGDNASDIMIIGDLWKTQVLLLGEYLGVPKNILAKKPTAELVAGVFDEDELGAPYEILDKILVLYLEQNKSIADIIEAGFDEKIIKNCVKRLYANEHKRQGPPIIRISEKSFHAQEWRMPVTNLFSGE